MKNCKRCNKSDVEFGIDNSKSDALNIYCKECNRQMDRRRRETCKYKQYRRTYKERTVGARYDYIRHILCKSVCIDCGNNNPLVLEFDHIIGDKLASITKLVCNSASYELIDAEIAKCVIRCANCHRIKTIERLSGRRLKWLTTSCKQCEQLNEY